MEDKYEGDYGINKSNEHAELNAKDGSLFVNQSKYEKSETETKTFDESSQQTIHKLIEHSRTNFT